MSITPSQHPAAPNPGVETLPDWPEGKHATLRVVPMPADANYYGDVFGGWIMSHIDVAGAIVAAQLAQGRVGTVAINAMQFRQPVGVGDLLAFYAEITRIGTTSVTVRVDVFAQRRLIGDIVKVTEATLTYVAMDEAGKKRKLPTA
ncbi:acyl-CoA thioesterase [Kerstersia similis]|uniref:acyl-CoA thioesterase n=1 Tax=Kerstersia similis TaxID=206505 RepID=UPI0039EF0866